MAELVTAAAIVLATALTGHAVPPPGGGVDPAAVQIAAVMGPVVGSLLCYLAGWWAARRAGTRFALHGATVGVSAAVMTGIGAVAGGKAPAAVYVVSAVLKILAGRAGGATAARMAAEERSRG